MIAWTRSQDGTTGLLVSRDGTTGFVNELALEERSASLATFRGHVLLAWRRNGPSPALHIATIT